MEKYEYKLPDLAEGTTEGEIAAWRVDVGEAVQEDQPLVDVMTDKAVVEIPSPVSGTVVSLHAVVGDKVPVGSVLVVFDVDRAAARDNVPSAPAADSTTVAAPALSDSLSESGIRFAGWSEQRQALTSPPARIAAAPSVRRRAREANIRLEHISGTGPRGRILHTDLDAALAHMSARIESTVDPSVRPADASAVEEVRILGMRRKIAERMSLSKRTIPHFGYVEEIDVTELEALRQHLNNERAAGQPRLTPLPFILGALARILPSYPDINATFDSEAGILRRYAAIHVGIATQTPAGLLVPVVRHVESCTLWACVAELARVTSAAREGKATREELMGSTITLSSLGALGGIAATPIINHPEVAIIGPNRIVDRPVVRGGQIVIRKMMNLSSSFDHRIVDGHVAAEFISRVKALLEMPATLFLNRA